MNLVQSWVAKIRVTGRTLHILNPEHIPTGGTDENQTILFLWNQTWPNCKYFMLGDIYDFRLKLPKVYTSIEARSSRRTRLSFCYYVLKCSVAIISKKKHIPKRHHTVTPRSPDLRPCDFFLQKYIKFVVYKTNSSTVT